MSPQHLFALLAFALAGCQSGPAALAPRYEFTDLSGDFVSFWDRTQGMPASDRIDAFKEQFKGRDFYDAQRFAGSDAAQLDQRITEAIGQFAQLRGRYRGKAAAFDVTILPALRTFQHSFPDMKLTMPVYLLHSLGEMDGGTRTLGGRTVLIFGADVMAQVHDFDDEQPFIHHELFHVYHQQFFTECPQVWCALWAEGLAVYAAQQLNPTATDSQLLLSAPEPIRSQVDAHLNVAMCAAKSKLESTDEGDTNAFFSFSRLSPSIPPRAGYYLGYLLAREAGRTRTPQQLARLSNDEARALLDVTITHLTGCP